VLRGVDLQVEPGAIHGLVGLNGAGKTTTIECALGLLRFDAGAISILGRPPRSIHAVGGRVGVALDTPGLHPQLTVRDELDLAWMLGGRTGRSPAEAEALAGLAPLRRVVTRKLSLGMRRRVSIARAILGRPELVVLDEPFSGLDPGGTEDLLDLLLRLVGEGGRSVLFSSHGLDLVERAATHATIIHEGRALRSGRMEEILAEASPRLRIEVDRPDRALAVLGGRPASTVSVRAATTVLDVDPGASSPAEINAALVGAGVAVHGLSPARKTLDAVFRTLTGRGA